MGVCWYLWRCLVNSNASEQSRGTINLNSFFTSVCSLCSTLMSVRSMYLAVHEILDSSENL